MCIKENIKRTFQNPLHINRHSKLNILKTWTQTLPLVLEKWNKTRKAGSERQVDKRCGYWKWNVAKHERNITYF